MPTLTTFIKSLVITAVIVLVGGGLFLYSGLYPMGADVPHNRLTYWLLETLRERSVARAASDIKVPSDLNAPERLLAGGADYNDMCAGCHLKPGRTQSDFTLGLYPAPPNLTLTGDEHGHDHAGTPIMTTKPVNDNSGLLNMASRPRVCPPGGRGMTMNVSGIWWRF